MKCRLLHDTQNAKPDTGYKPAGTVLDVRVDKRYKPAHIITLVQLGAAEPADDECLVGCQRTREQLAAAQRAYNRCRHGIHPDDFAAFDSGQIVGYDKKGNLVPGPNYVEPIDDTGEDEDEDEDYE